MRRTRNLATVDPVEDVCDTGKLLGLGIVAGIFSNPRCPVHHRPAAPRVGRRAETFARSAAISLRDEIIE